jgi:hypothetical protein
VLFSGVVRLKRTELTEGNDIKQRNEETENLSFSGRDLEARTTRQIPYQAVVKVRR